MKIKITEVFLPPDRQRSKVSEGKIAELAVSLKAQGQLHPITVAPIDRVRFPDASSHLQYQLVAGYRRFLATALLKEMEIEANLRTDLNELQLSEIELDENLMREELSWQDEVRAKSKLLEVRKKLYGEGIREVAEHVNESRGELWEDSRLAKAMEIMPELATAKNKTQAQSKLRLIARREALEAKAAAAGDGSNVELEAALKSFEHKVKQGDCLEVVKSWNSGIIDCVITDPPYGISLDKGETKKGSNHPMIYSETGEADENFDVMDLYDRVAKEAFRLLKDNTHAYFWFDIKSYDRVLGILRSAGFTVDAIPLIWAKPGPGQVNHPESRWASAYEVCFFCRKGNRALLKQGQSNLLRHDPVPPKQKIHPVEKPTSLIRQLIESSTVAGEVVLDFFGGSGSTAEAAMQTGRNFLIIEKDPGYYMGIVERLSGVDLSSPESEEDDEAEYDARNK